MEIVSGQRNRLGNVSRFEVLKSRAGRIQTIPLLERNIHQMKIVGLNVGFSNRHCPLCSPPSCVVHQVPVSAQAVYKLRPLRENHMRNIRCGNMFSAVIAEFRYINSREKMFSGTEKGR